MHWGTHILLSYICNWKEYDLLVLCICRTQFDNKFDQIDEADCMFMFQIKHQYSFWIIAHILFNALLRVLNRFAVPYSLKSPRNSECKLAHIYGMNKGKAFMSCVLYTYKNLSSATFNNCAWIIFSQNTSNLAGYLFIKAFF
jgi:hypothetical protein